jgi:hypothetical protein
MNILSRYFYDLGFLIIKGENCRGRNFLHHLHLAEQVVRFTYVA